MKTPVRFSRDRATYTGQISRAPFVEWARSPEGNSALEQAASRMSFALFGKKRAAGERLWKQLAHAARTEAAVLIVQREMDRYLTHLSTLVFAHDLPCAGIDLRRLVVVPRMFVNGQAYRRIDTALRGQAAFASLDGGDSLRRAFVVALVDGLAAAIAGARPSPSRPLPAGGEWITVGVNERFEWRIPFDGPAWPGHYFVLELTRTPLTRTVRKAVGETIVRLEASLSSLSRVRRSEILRQAGSSLDQLVARA